MADATLEENTGNEPLSITAADVISAGNTSQGNAARGILERNYINVGSGSTIYVSNSEASDYNITSQGKVYVQEGGTLSNATVNTYGGLFVSGSGASIVGANVSGLMASIWVSSGGVASATSVGYLGTVNLYSGASSISSVVSSGGVIYAGRKYGASLSSGLSIDDTVLRGGTLCVENFGSATGANISSGGRILVDTSGVSTSAIIQSGGSAIVTAGGTMFDAVVNAGGVITNSGSAPNYPATVDSRGVTSGTHVLSGGTIIINSGGLSYNDSADSGGSVIVNSYGSAYLSNINTQNYFVTSLGRVFVNEGATLSNVDVSTYGAVQVSGVGAVVQNAHVSGTFATISAVDGAVVSNADLAMYGSLSLGSGGTSISSVISAWGVVYAGRRSTPLSGGVSIGDTVMSGGSLVVENYGSAFRPIIESRGVVSATTSGTVTSAVVKSGGTLSISIANNSPIPGQGFNNYIAAGGTEIVGSGAVENGAIIASGGTIVINDQGGLISGRLEEHGSIDFNYLGAAITSANITSDGLLTVRASNGRTTSLQLAGTYKHNEFSFSGDTLTFLCFLAGTHIRTPDGEVLVEDLRIGDIVSVWDWKAGVETTRKLRWVGRQPIKVDPDLPDDEAGYPVRFLANCIAPNLPERDLLVTPEHCLFFDGKFVPARMLVNGVSIYYDKTITGAYAYHIETEDGHSILWAESALSESYLDTGNRRQFFQHGPLVQFGRDRVYDWAKDAAAPLDVSRATVEPLYERFAQRAVLRAPHRATTFDKALALKTSDGKVFRPVRVKDARHVFLIEGDVASLTLVSNASRPSDVIGPFVDDRRRLGVLVDGISVFGNTGMRAFTMHLQSGSLFGWLPLEAGQVGRWTQGEALLPLHLKADNGPHLIAIDVIAGGPYLVPVPSEKPARIMSVEEEEPVLALSP